jgi:hypothetical protein
MNTNNQQIALDWWDSLPLDNRDYLSLAYDGHKWMESSQKILHIWEKENPQPVNSSSVLDGQEFDDLLHTYIELCQELVGILNAKLLENKSLQMQNNQLIAVLKGIEDCTQPEGGLATHESINEWVRKAIKSIKSHSK